tara:strand:+ start:1527 stop:2108 length:582 start_codon:yes stop_codon:yes gene_type:complete
MKKEIKQTSISIITQNITKHSNLTPANAWYEGTNIRFAYKEDPRIVHAYCMALLKDAIEYLDFNKSFRNTKDYIDAVDYLIEQFPAMKLEEWALIMKRLKAGYYGKMFERLKLPELVDIFQRHEGERGDMMKRKVKQDRKEEDDNKRENLFNSGMGEVLKKIAEDLKLPEDDTDRQGRWKFIQYPNTEIKPEE